MRWLVLLGVAVALSACTSSREPGSRALGTTAAKSASSDALPVSSVTLYATGVAFVEHQGKVTDDVTVALRSRPEQVPGILKSLVVHDRAAAERPVVALPLPDKGAKAEEDDPDGSLMHSIDGGQNPPATAPAKARPLAVQLKGTGDREVRIGYALEAQPWKVSYRLMLGDERPSLQAWATVANDSEYDWKKVRLNLVSGRPLVLAAGASATDSAVVSKAVKAAGVATGESLLRPRLVPSRQALDAPPESVQAPAPPEARAPEALPTTLPLLDPREVFRFPVEGVSVPRGGTVVLPVLGDAAVAVERVAVYNERTLGRNPLQGARVRNATPHYLLAGTVSVQDRGEFVGDAALSNLAPGREALVTWGIDLPVLVDSTHEAVTTGVRSARLEKGVLHVVREHVYARRYTVDNEDRADRVVVVEHPLRRGWTLADADAAASGLIESTETLHRFRLLAPAGKRSTLLVRERTPEAEDVELALADADTVLALSREPGIEPTVREALAGAAAQKTRLLERERQLRDRQADLDRVLAEQARARQALEALGAQDPGRARLQAKLEAADAQAAELTKAIDQAQGDLEKADAELRAGLAKLDAGR